MDWRNEFFDFENIAYLNAASQGPIPRVSARALEQAANWKKLPHHIPDSAYFELPDRVRARLARLIGGEPGEVALTTGASGGLAAVASGLEWKPDDEVLLARGEFPAHFSTFAPLAEQGRLKLRIVEPRGRFITADDFIAAMGPRTRLISASLVRFDDASRLDAKRLAAACRETGTLLLLDASQCVGGLPLDVGELGADFLVAAGYKWLLSPYGTGFFWVRRALIERLRLGPFYWQALEGAADFHSLPLTGWKVSPEARRWDTAETGNFFNLAVMDASLEFLERVGPATVAEHNEALLQQIVERLPRDRCVLASPAEPAARGTFLCLAGRSPQVTKQLYERLREGGVIVSLREGALRIAPHLYNTERDIDRLLGILAV